MPRRLSLRISYDGTDYHGWQIQPGLPTIQSTIEEVLAALEGKYVHLEGSGRTDAGVHALGVVAACTLDNPIPTDNLRRALNRRLPDSIRILAVEERHPSFHPRFDAIAKTYEYRIWREEICPPFVRRYVHYHPYPLDETAMQLAAARYLGEHDFAAFASADEADVPGEPRVRRIFSSELWRAGETLHFRVRGSGFLKHMVRHMVGLLIEVGRGNERPEDVDSYLLGAPAKVRQSVPGQGLTQISVEYPLP